MLCKRPRAFDSVPPVSRHDIVLTSEIDTCFFRRFFNRHVLRMFQLIHGLIDTEFAITSDSGSGGGVARFAYLQSRRVPRINQSFENICCVGSYI